LANHSGQKLLVVVSAFLVSLAPTQHLDQMLLGKTVLIPALSQRLTHCASDILLGEIFRSLGVLLLI
jgi:hypothetical protein